MVLLDAWRLEGRRIVDLLAVDEAVLAFTPTTLGTTHFGSLDRLRPTPTDGKPSLFWKVAGAIGAFVGFVPSLFDRLTARFSNDPVAGSEGSLARTIGRQVDASPLGHQHYLAVTDRRLLIMHGVNGAPEPLTLVAEVDRPTIRNAEVRANALAASIGRLRVTFVDGSWLEFADVLNMGRHRAGTIRDALVDGRRSVKGEPGPPPQ